MKALRTLIRLHRQAVDEVRRRLAALERRLDQLVRDARLLEVRLAEEQALVAGNPGLGFGYGPYARRVILERRRLEEGRLETEKEIAKVRDQLAEAFAELKKYEIARDARARRLMREAERRERILLDEIALVAHRRRYAAGV